MSAFVVGMRDILIADGAVSALVVGRVYPHGEEAQKTSPYITYQLVGGLVPTRTFQGPTYDTWSIQFDCWSTEPPGGTSKYAEVAAVGDAVIAALDQNGGLLNGQRVDVINLADVRDLVETGWRRRQVDFTALVRR